MKTQEERQAMVEKARKDAFYDTLGDIIQAMGSIDQAMSMVARGSITYKALNQAWECLNEIDLGDIDFDLREISR